MTTERTLVAGLLSGRLTPRAVRDVNPRKFQDFVLAVLFATSESCLKEGAVPLNRRVVPVASAILRDYGGVPDGLDVLIDQLRAEG
jgi:hypothetical protein